MRLVADPVRGLLDRREKGNEQKGAAPGYKLQKTNAKIIPPKTETRNIQSSGKKQNKTETKTEKQARR